MAAADKAPAEHATLTEARLYLGEQDSVFEHYQLRCGEVALATVGDSLKPGPNEDSAAIIPVNDSHVVLVVADGVGGLAGARQASNLTVQAIRKSLAKAEGIPGNSLRTAILDGIESANHAVRESGGGGASTLALAEIGPKYVRSYHVGDSILMLCGQRGLLKLATTPHSPVGFAMEAGLINEKEALEHAELNIIFNVIGSADMRIEIGSEQPIASHDTLLLASDGLADNLLQQEMIEAIRKGPLKQSLQTVTQMALRRMSTQQPGKPSKPDDLTTLLFRRRPKPRRRRTQ